MHILIYKTCFFLHIGTPQVCTKHNCGIPVSHAPLCEKLFYPGVSFDDCLKYKISMFESAMKCCPASYLHNFGYFKSLLSANYDTREVAKINIRVKSVYSYICMPK